MGQGVPWAGATLDLFQVPYRLLQLGRHHCYTQLWVRLKVLVPGIRVLCWAELSFQESSV